MSEWKNKILFYFPFVVGPFDLKFWVTEIKAIWNCIFRNSLHGKASEKMVRELSFASNLAEFRQRWHFKEIKMSN